MTLHPPESSELPRLFWHPGDSTSATTRSASEVPLLPVRTACHQWVTVRWTSSPKPQLPSSLIKFINTPSVFEATLLTRLGPVGHHKQILTQPESHQDTDCWTNVHWVTERTRDSALCHLIRMMGTPTHCCHCPTDAGWGTKPHRHGQGRMIYWHNQVCFLPLLDARIPTKGKGQNRAPGLCWAVGKFSSHLSEHGFNLKSRPNICSQRTPARCRCLQTPEVKNQEQCWCEPHIPCE